MCFLKGCLETKIDIVIQNGSNCTHGLTMMKLVIVSHVLFVSAITKNQKETLNSLLHQQIIQIGNNMLFIRLMNTKLQVIIDQQ